MAQDIRDLLKQDQEDQNLQMPKIMKLDFCKS